MSGFRKSKNEEEVMQDILAEQVEQDTASQVAQDNSTLSDPEQEKKIVVYDVWLRLIHNVGLIKNETEEYRIVPKGQWRAVKSYEISRKEFEELEKPHEWPNVSKDVKRELWRAGLVFNYIDNVQRVKQAARVSGISWQDLLSAIS